MKYLAPPTPARDELIAEAFRRNINSGVLAKVFGISQQRIFQLVARYERRRGPIARNHKGGKPPGVARTLFRCWQCGRRCWTRPADVKTRFYCSYGCGNRARRELNDSEIADLIELRMMGTTWKELAIVAGHPVQVVQVNIWMLLWRQGNLTSDRLSDIWLSVPSPTRRPSWQWIINRIGVIPS